MKKIRTNISAIPVETSTLGDGTIVTHRDTEMSADLSGIYEYEGNAGDSHIKKDYVTQYSGVALSHSSIFNDTFYMSVLIVKFESGNYPVLISVDGGSSYPIILNEDNAVAILPFNDGSGKISTSIYVKYNNVTEATGSTISLMCNEVTP